MISAKRKGLKADRAIEVYVVKRSDPKVYTRPLSDLNALRTSPTGDVICHRSSFEKYRRLGTEGSGIELFQSMFSLERILCSYLYLAAIHCSKDLGMKYAQERRAFGKPIGENQYIQERIVQMRIAEETLQALLSKTMGDYLRNKKISASLSICKIYGIEVALKSVEHLLRIYGARGLLHSFGAEKLLRDLHGLAILGGTIELQKIMVYNESARRVIELKKGRRNLNNSNIKIEIILCEQLSPSQENLLINLTGRVFPGEESLKGKYYFDSKPTYVCIAKVGEQVVGLRPVTLRKIQLNGRSIRVAGGIIPAIDPNFRRQGIAKKMVDLLLEKMRDDGEQLSLAFLFNRAPQEFLDPFMYRRVHAKWTYEDKITGELIEEQMPAFALALEANALVEEIESVGSIYLGVGTF